MPRLPAPSPRRPELRPVRQPSALSPTSPPASSTSSSIPPLLVVCTRQGLQDLTRQTLTLSNKTKHNATFPIGLQKAFAPRVVLIGPDVGGYPAHSHNSWCLAGFLVQTP